MAEIGRRAVDTMDVVPKEHRRIHDYDEYGRFRWPKAILMVRAWRFEPQPKVLDVLASQLPYNATPQAVLLSDRDAAAVLRLNAIEEILPMTEALANARLLDGALAAARPTTGPTPSTWVGSAGRNVNRDAFTYALRFGRTNTWKIGHAVDLAERVREVNWHIPPEVVPNPWFPVLQQRWPDEISAHGMEQRVLKLLERYRTEGERVRCSEDEIWMAWKAAIGV
ncbi:hypothetical protein [Microvirga rosea]|uniref:hypothetical protein n=1 Tax=Microvirga rosea TaxID=2715425 RepID=UPI001D0A93FB|nr:hypothetical protein [Microvirga rosea]MCB8821915.1 hypothetical protein [Microvirga rosea]